MQGLDEQVSSFLWHQPGEDVKLLLIARQDHNMTGNAGVDARQPQKGGRICLREIENKNSLLGSHQRAAKCRDQLLPAGASATVNIQPSGKREWTDGAPVGQLCDALSLCMVVLGALS